MKEILEKLNNAKGIILTIGAIVGGVIGGYWWLQDSIVERNSEVITTAVIESIKKDINPMDRTTYLEFRRRDSIERLHAELLALRFMNKQDSIDLVMTEDLKRLASIEYRLDLIDLKMEVDSLTKVDDELAKIWEFLQEKASIDSTRFKIQMDLEMAKKKNVGRLDNIKSGDRLK